MNKIISDNSFRGVIPVVGVIFFSTFASMMVNATLPTFIVEKLKINYQQLGYIEGWAVFSAFISKFLSGIISDKIRKRKKLIIIGTVLSIFAKFCFAVTTGFLSIFIVKVFDRVAKGIRSCPSDAMIGDIASNKSRDFFYALKYMLFTAGAVCGGYASHILLRLTNNNFRVVFITAIIPALIAFFLSHRFLEDSVINEKKDCCQESQKIGFMSAIKKFDKFFIKFLLVIFFLMFARFSESFLVVKARVIGFSVESIPLLIVMYDACSFCSALLFGLLSFKIDRKVILKLAIVIQFFAHTISYFAISKNFIILSGILFGIHVGMSQGVLLALISSFSKDSCRATAFSIYYTVVAFSLLLGNSLAGKLNTILNSTSGAFLGGAFFSLIAFCVLYFITRPTNHNDYSQTSGTRQ